MSRIFCFLSRRRKRSEQQQLAQLVKEARNIEQRSTASFAAAAVQIGDVPRKIRHQADL